MVANSAEVYWLPRSKLIRPKVRTATGATDHQPHRGVIFRRLRAHPYLRGGAITAGGQGWSEDAVEGG